MSDWLPPFLKKLERDALAEYRVQRNKWLKLGRSPKTFRYSPPEWQRMAIEACNENNEERAKAILLFRN